jgi:hypothetical protein
MKNQESKHYDAVSLLAAEYEMILERLFELEKMISNSNDGASLRRFAQNFAEQFGLIYEQTVKYFRIEEEIVFPQLENVLPQHASPDAMKNEHNRIIEMMFALKEHLSSNSINELYMIPAELLKLTDNFQRVYHKKQDVMYRELYSFITNAALEKIYLDLKQKFSKE